MPTVSVRSTRDARVKNRPQSFGFMQLEFIAHTLSAVGLGTYPGQLSSRVDSTFRSVFLLFLANAHFSDCHGRERAKGSKSVFPPGSDMCLIMCHISFVTCPMATLHSKQTGICITGFCKTNHSKLVFFTTQFIISHVSVSRPDNPFTCISKLLGLLIQLFLAGGQLGWINVLDSHVWPLVLPIGWGALVLCQRASHPPGGSADFLTWQSQDGVPRGQRQELQGLLSPCPKTHTTLLVKVSYKVSSDSKNGEIVSW